MWVPQVWYLTNQFESAGPFAGHILNMQPIPRRRGIGKGTEALSEVHERASHVPYEAAVKQLRQFSLTRRRIRGDLIAMFKITHGLLEFPMESTFDHPTRKGLRGHTYRFHQQR